MTAKEFLQSIRMERMEVDHMSDMLEELRTSLLPSAIRYDKIDVQVSLPDDPMAETYAKIEEVETRTETQTVSPALKSGTGRSAVKRAISAASYC